MAIASLPASVPRRGSLRAPPPTAPLLSPAKGKRRPGRSKPGAGVGESWESAPAPGSLVTPGPGASSRGSALCSPSSDGLPPGPPSQAGRQHVVGRQGQPSRFRREAGSQGEGGGRSVWAPCQEGGKEGRPCRPAGCGCWGSPEAGRRRRKAAAGSGRSSSIRRGGAI